jgi:hypothetical protein
MGLIAYSELSTYEKGSKELNRRARRGDVQVGKPLV